MSSPRVMVPFLAVALHLAVYAVLGSACSSGDALESRPGAEAASVQLAFASHVLTADGPTGSTYQVIIDAGAPALTITFAGQPSAVTLSPASAVTDAHGHATTYAFVPYDVTGIIVASAAGAVPKELTLANPAVTISAGMPKAVESSPAGTTFEVPLTATGPALPGGVAAAAGVSLSIAGQPSGVAVSPSSVVTDLSGKAKAYAFVPYDVSGELVVSANGAPPQSVAIANEPVVLSGSQGSVVANSPNGSTYAVTVSGGVPGLGIAVTGQPSGVTVSPVTVVADDTGTATTYAFIPYGTQGAVLASAAGALSTSIPVSSQAVTLTPGTPTMQDGVTPTGQVWTLPVVATTMAGGPLPGLSVQFAPSSGSPTTVVTDQQGSAAAKLFAPWGPSVPVTISGGGSVRFSSLPAAPNPIMLSQLCWRELSNEGPGLYQVYTKATVSGVGLAGVTVAFAVINPSGAATSTSVFEPPSALTDGTGAASSIIALGGPVWFYDAGPPLVAIEATAGSSTQPAVLQLGMSASQGVCP